MKEKICAVIPAYNEQESIGEVLDHLHIHVDNIIVVDDGSSDETSRKAKNHGFTVIRHKQNQGYDKSISDGFREAIKQNATVIFTFDADGQHHSEDVPQLLDPILKGNADVVVGIRPCTQRFSERIFSWYAQKKIGIHDPLCGVKAYSSIAYKHVGYFDAIHSIGTELLFNCNKKGYRIQEVPIKINIRKDNPRFGNSIKANMKILLALIKICIKFK
jgi:glycosyltransferase involved in cell wall biosynthesis